MKRTITALVLGVALLLASGGGGYAQDFGKGLEAAQRGNYAVAYWEWTVAAEQGDAVAQLFLGQMFFEGLGVLQDYKVAKMWFEKSASNNISMAQNNLGSIYENGKGVAQDLQKAAIWYQKAAVQGDKNAQFNLGLMYEQGKGVAQDQEEAVQWFRQAAEQGNMMAQNNLGSIYENGKGVAQDLQKAAIWYQKAAVQGDKNAQFNLGAFYFDEGGDLNLMYSYMWFKISLENGVNIARENVDFLKTKMSSSHLEKADFFIYECLKKQRGCLERLALMTFNPLTQSR